MTKKPKPTTIKLRFLKAAWADRCLSAPAKCVLFALVMEHHNDETDLCNPGFSAIAEDIGRDPIMQSRSRLA